MFEKPILNRLNNFLLETRNLFFQNQHGFIKNRSTASAILSLVNNVVIDFDNGQCLTGLFYLSKAFDMVNRELILEKIGSHGILRGCT